MPLVILSGYAIRILYETLPAKPIKTGENIFILVIILIALFSDAGMFAIYSSNKNSQTISQLSKYSIKLEDNFNENSTILADVDGLWIGYYNPQLDVRVLGSTFALKEAEIETLNKEITSKLENGNPVFITSRLYVHDGLYPGDDRFTRLRNTIEESYSLLEFDDYLIQLNLKDESTNNQVTLD